MPKPLGFFSRPEEDPRPIPPPGRPYRNGEDRIQTYGPAPLSLYFGRQALDPPALATIVSEILYAGSLTLIYGPPKSGKSFLTTDLALAIASGRDNWMGHTIRVPCDVLYIACEGQGGFWKRLTAADQQRYPHPDNFILATGNPMLIRSQDRGGYLFVPDPSAITQALSQCIEQGMDPRVVFIDTVFRSFGAGNVNNSQDMNSYLAAIGTLTDLGLAVAVVHHQNKSSVTPSGSVSLIGGADTILRVWRETQDGEDDDEPAQQGQRYWQIEMAKDGAETLPRGFTLQVIDVGTDADGEPATSCIVVDNGSSRATQPSPRRGRPPRDNSETALNSRLILRELTNMLADPSQPSEKVLLSGVEFTGVRRGNLRVTINQRGFSVTPPENAAPKEHKKAEEKARQAYSRALKVLADKGEIVVIGNIIALPVERDINSRDIP